jgi:hypothetical protein
MRIIPLLTVRSHLCPPILSEYIYCGTVQDDVRSVAVGGIGVSVGTGVSVGVAVGAGVSVGASVAVGASVGASSSVATTATVGSPAGASEPIPDWRSAPLDSRATSAITATMTAITMPI